MLSGLHSISDKSDDKSVGLLAAENLRKDFLIVMNDSANLKLQFHCDSINKIDDYDSFKKFGIPVERGQCVIGKFNILNRHYPQTNGDACLFRDRMIIKK